MNQSLLMSDLTRKSIIFAISLKNRVFMSLDRLLLSVFIICVLASCNSTSNDSNHEVENGLSTDVNLSEDSSDFEIDRTYSEETSTRGDIYLTVDISLKPVIEPLINTFMAQYPKATLRPIYLPGEEAIYQMLQGDSIRLAISTRQLNQEETSFLDNLFIVPEYSKVARDGIALLIHEINQDSILGINQLKQILKGEITDWKDVGEDGRKGKISVVFDHPRSGTIKWLQDSIMNGQQIRGKHIFALDSAEEVTDYIRNNPNAIGIVGSSLFNDEDDPRMEKMKQGIKIVLVDGVQNQELCPYSDTVFGPYQSFFTTECYALSRPVFTIRREIIFGLGTGFIAYMTGNDGQRIIHKTGVGAVKGIPRQVKFPPKKGAKDPRKTTPEAI